MASASQQETISTGSIILSSSASEAEGTVTYSLTDADNKFAINSATGEVTLASALDFETKTSHTFTVTATDGTTTKSETFTLNISDVDLGALVTSQSALATENTSSGTALYAVSSIENDGSSPTYSITAGNDGGLFAVNSSTGAISTTATALDFETAKSHTLTLTATVGSDTTSTNVVVPVYNVEELNSSVLRYSAAYNSASRTGFSATATRGPSGSSLPAYYLEQIGTTATSVITDVDNISNNSVPVEIAGGTALNWRYFFPIDTAGAGKFAFAPNSASVDAKYKSLLGTNVITTISNSEFITAGRLSGGNFWFMATDKAGSNISYQSTSGQRTHAILIGQGNTDTGNVSQPAYWTTAASNAGYSVTNCINLSQATCLSNMGISDLSDVGLIVQPMIPHETAVNDNYNGHEWSNTDLANWIDGGGNFHGVIWETGGPYHWGAEQNMADFNAIFSTLGWGSASGSSINQHSSAVSAPSGSGYSLDYSGLPSGNLTLGAAYGYNSIPSVCTELASDIFFVCDPGKTGSAGVVSGVPDYNWAFYSSNYGIMDWIAGLNTNNPVTSTYNLFEDQVTLAGRIYTDAMLTNLYSSSPYQGTRHVFAYAVIPIENFAPSGTTNDYFYPNFIPTNLWSYGDLGLDYCAGYISNNQCTSYEENYEWSSYTLDHNQNIWTTRFNAGASYVPQGQSLWWQVVYPPGGGNGVSVGLWAQISFKDSYDGASGSTTRDDQESLLNVVISTIDYRKHDTTRYSAGDTGLSMDGYHYWSYQGATNANNDGLGINYGTSTIECATSNDSGCFWADGGTDIPRAAMITSSDPYKSGNMTLSVNYNSNTDTFSTGSFNAAIIQQDIRTSTGTSASVNIGEFRTTDFYQTNHNASCGGCHSGFFSGILEFDVSGSGNSQLASMRSSSTLATFNFDYAYDYMQAVAPMTISAAPANNYTSNWTTVDTGSMTLKFGDATNDEAKSAFISAEVFAAEIQDDGAQIDGSSGGSNNLAGVMVSYNTLDNVDGDLFHNGGNDFIPDTAYSTWGFWAMSSVDISPNNGDQNASVHLGTWVSGQTLAQNEIPTSGSASMSGAAVMNVAYRYNQTGTNYDVHKYTTTADVAASFNWGASGYTGQFNFTNFDDKNAIVANAGFTSFAVNISGSGATYTGSLADTNNGWTREAVIAGALYGGSSPDESGGRLGVGLSKSGALGTAGANDFYMAEGIYLID